MSENNDSILGTELTAPYVPNQDEKTLAILCHILCLIGWFIPPLVIYLVKKDESQFVKAHALESLNFQITLALVFFVGIVLTLVLIGILVLWLAGLASLVFCIVATIKASEGKLYKYPFCIRLIK